MYRLKSQAAAVELGDLFKVRMVIKAVAACREYTLVSLRIVDMAMEYFISEFCYILIAVM